MAEAIASRQASDIIEPSSAGLYPLGYIAERTAETLLANGYGVADLSSKPLRRRTIGNADLIVNLSGERLEELLNGWPPVEDWNVPDPYGADVATYQRILEEIESRMRELAERLRAAQCTGKS